MKPSRFTDSQIMAILKQAENDVPVPKIRREDSMYPLSASAQTCLVIQTELKQYFS